MKYVHCILHTLHESLGFSLTGLFELLVLGWLGAWHHDSVARLPSHLWSCARTSRGMVHDNIRTGLLDRMYVTRH